MDELSEFLKKNGYDATPDEIVAIIRRLDTDGSQTISLIEFSKYLQLLTPAPQEVDVKYYNPTTPKFVDLPPTYYRSAHIGIHHTHTLDIHTTADTLPHTGDPHTLMDLTTPHLITHHTQDQPIDLIMTQCMTTFQQPELSTPPQSEKRLCTLLHTPQ